MPIIGVFEKREPNPKYFLTLTDDGDGTISLDLVDSTGDTKANLLYYDAKRGVFAAYPNYSPQEKTALEKAGIKCDSVGRVTVKGCK